MRAGSASGSRGDDIDDLSRLVGLLDPPIGVYIVDPQGRFLFCNRRARSIFGLGTGPIEKSIASLYEDKDERARLLREVVSKEREGGFLEGALFAIRVDQHQKWVHACCKSIRTDDGELIGFLGCVTDAIDPDAFIKLSGGLQIGLFRLGADGTFHLANASVAEMLQYESESSLRGTQMRDLFLDKSQSVELLSELREKGHSTHQAAWRRRDGETIHVRIDARSLAESGEYKGCHGLITDITAEENYRLILDTITVGTYMIIPHGSEQRVVACNDEFARIFGLSSATEMLGENILRYYRNPEEDFPVFVDALREQAKADEAVAGYRLRIVKADKQEKTVEVSTRGFFDSAGTLLRRVGVILDVTDIESLISLRGDIGNMLHSYSAGLVRIWDNILPSFTFLAPDPFARGADRHQHDIPPRTALRSVRKPAERLQEVVGDLSAASSLLPRSLDRLFRLGEALRDSLEVNAESSLRGAIEALDDILCSCGQIRRLIDASRKPQAARVALEQARKAAREAERLGCLLDLHTVCHIIARMEHEVAALSEHLEQRMETPQKREARDVSWLISRVIADHRRFAASRSVRIRPLLDADASVLVDERMILRALGNLLHNAIKYTWSPVGDSRRDLVVRTRTQEERIHIDFTNFGVPIRREEIESGELFRFGYRGDFADDRWRTGTGVGLADAKRIAEEHKGTVTIDSYPSDPADPPDDYAHMFRTTATLTLPVCGKEVRRDAKEGSLD